MSGLYDLDPHFWLGTLASQISHDLVWRRTGIDDKGRAMEKTLNEMLSSGVFSDEARDLLPKVPKVKR